MTTYYRVAGVRGLAAAIKGRIIKDPILLKIQTSDTKFPFCLRVPSSDVYTYRQIFIYQEYDFDFTRNPKIIVDAGANIGLASIYFSEKFPESKIYAIEPENSNFEILKINIVPYDNVTPIHGALWDENKEINLVDPGLGKWGFRIEEERENRSLGQMCQVVQGLTIDSIMKEQGIEHIDILKIDIEGAEREIFRDPSSWIGKVDALIIELHEHLKPGCNRSFYNSTNGFDDEWSQGEHVYLTRRKGCLRRRPVNFRQGDTVTGEFRR